MDKTKLKPLAWHHTATNHTPPLDYVPDVETPTRTSRTAYIAGLFVALTFGLLLGALLVSA